MSERTSKLGGTQLHFSLEWNHYVVAVTAEHNSGEF
jgi:hypothetical protein